MRNGQKKWMILLSALVLFSLGSAGILASADPSADPEMKEFKVASPSEPQEVG